MQVRNHVKYSGEPGSWLRGRDVSLSDGCLCLSLDFTRQYRFVQVYARTPHLQFVKCESDDDFAWFAQTWGPLTLEASEVRAGSVVAPLREYRSARNWMRSLVGLMVAFRRNTGHRAALGEYFRAAADRPGARLWQPLNEFSEQALISKSLGRDDLPAVQLSAHRLFCPGEPVLNWMETAPATAVRKALAYVIESVELVKAGHLCASVQDAAPVIGVRWELTNLIDALKWMLWQDEWDKHPILFCAECRSYFQPRNAHDRKYCSPECAHKAAARAWWKRTHGKQSPSRGETHEATQAATRSL